MKFGVVGTGAIGGFTGARLALAGAEVTFLARGESLAAIRKSGLKLVHADGREEIAKARATDDVAEALDCDTLLLAMKAHQLPALAPALAPHLRKHTTVIPMQNGIPFWYFHGLSGPHEGRIVESVDPGGVVARAIEPKQVIGCVVYTAAERTSPGVIHHVLGERFPVGELDGAISPRLQALEAAFATAGLKAQPMADIRTELWMKLWGNAAFNPISALGRATLGGIAAHPEGRALAERGMRETQAVAAAFGVTFTMTLEKRIENAARVGAHKTSMLQDVESGRPLELAALVEAVLELGRITGTPTPHLGAVFAEVQVADPVQPVLDTPVAADDGGKLGVGGLGDGQRGDRVAGFA